MVKFDFLLNGFQLQRVVFVPDVGFKVEHVGDAFDCQKGNLHVVEIFADSLDRGIEHDQGGDERYEVARSDGAVDDQIAAVADDRADADGNHHMHERRHPAGFFDHFHRQFEQRAQNFVKLAVHSFLQVVGSDGFAAGVAFVVMRQNAGRTVDGVLDQPLNAAFDLRQRQQGAQQHHDGDDRKLPGIVNQHRNQRQGGKKAGNEKFQIVEQSQAGGVGVAGKALDDNARRIPVEKGRFKAHQFFKQGPFQVVVDAGADPGVEIGGGVVEKTLHGGKGDDKDRNVDRRSGVLVHQHIVHIGL